MAYGRRDHAAALDRAPPHRRRRQDDPSLAAAGRGPGRRKVRLSREVFAAFALAAGMLVTAAGIAGLVAARHPAATRWGTVAAVPAPVGPIAGAVQSQDAKVPLPVALTIPAIGVQASLVHLGLTAAGALAVPPSTVVAGWYTGSPRPGAIGPAVIAGHIDSHTGPGVFFGLSRLRPGDHVYVRRADGTLAVFRVTAVRSYAKDRFPTLAVYGPTPDAELRLITCGGAFDPQRGSYLSNTVVYAVQVSHGPKQPRQPLAERMARYRCRSMDMPGIPPVDPLLIHMPQHCRAIRTPEDCRGPLRGSSLVPVPAHAPQGDRCVSRGISAAAACRDPGFAC